MSLPKVIFVWSLSLLIGAFAGFLYWSISDLPEIKSLERYTPKESTFIYSSDGKVLAELYLERRQYVPHYKIPDRVKNAFIAIEDQRFYEHPGVDVIGIMRALYRDIMAQSIVEGGSTITQQLAKMLFLNQERSISRKIKEAALSIQIEKRYTKDEILEMYLNQAYFGTRAYGIEAASQTYFGKSSSELSIAEAALIAGLPKAPSIYSPFKNPDKALIRRNIVLKKMLENRFISEDEHAKAIREPIPAKPNYRRYEAPYFIELLRQQLENRYGESINTSGFKVYSSIDYDMQKKAEDAVKKGIKLINRRTRPGVQAALVAIDITNGQIKAMIGGTDFWETQFNRATTALRQPGSAFKPFVYLAALQNGLHADTKINDAPVSFKGANPGIIWSPKNYDNKYHGYISLKKALALSLNTATVRLAHNIGIDDIAELARRCGIKSKLDPYLSLALGSSDVTLLELTSAYSVFASGYRIEPILYTTILNRDGISIEEKNASFESIVDEEIVSEMREFLREVVDSGTAQKAKELNRIVYGKTGTTNDFSDAWFIGFDDRLVVGVWVGRDDHKPIGPKETGAQAALPIWIDFMKAIQ